MKSSIRTRFLTILAAIVLVSLISGTISVIWTRNLGQQFHWISDWTLPFGKELVQLSSDLDLLKRELDRSVGVTYWNDPRWKARKIPQWALDLITNDLDRIQSLSAPADQSWKDWISRMREQNSGLVKDSGSLFETLQAQNFDQANQIYPSLMSHLDLLQRELVWAKRRTDRETRNGFQSASEQVQSLETAQKVLFALILLVSLLVLWLGERAILPLVRMRDWVKQVTDGVSPSKVSLNPEELGELAHDVRAMSTALEEKDKALDFHQKRLEEQNRLLQQVMDKLDESERLAAIGRMSAQVAHDVGNPLHSIGLEAEIALEDLNDADVQNKTPQIKQSVKHILESVARLRGIVDRYLRLSKAKSVQHKKFDLVSVLESVMATYTNAFQGSHIRVDWRRMSDLGHYEVMGDAELMEQVLGNLFANSIQAIQAVKDPARSKLISIELSNEAGKIYFSIEDSGDGVPNVIQKSMFQAFVTSKANGTGLGLSFSKQVIESFGGAIELVPGKGTGAKFIVSLPEAGAEVYAPTISG